MDNSPQPEQEVIISNVELSSIYKATSIEDNSDFDEKTELEFIDECIEKCYSQDNIASIHSEKFLLIDSKKLQNDVTLLNISFVKLVHFCNQNYKYKNVTKMFISYCDYFNLDYHLVYKVLHNKLQTLIKNGFIKMLGGIKKFNALDNKLNPNKITTLFDLIANK